PAAKPAPPPPPAKKPEPPPPIAIAKKEDEDSIDIAMNVATVPPPVAEIVAGTTGKPDVLVTEKPDDGGFKADAEGLDAQAHYERAYKLVSSGANDRAEEALAKAFALDPKH